jgi:hypothetical protein
MLELPARLLADKVAIGLMGALGVVVEAVMARQPQGVTGAGLLLAGALMLWFGYQRRAGGRLARVSLEPAGSWRLTYVDGHVAEAALGRGSRVLGGSVVLKWRVDGRPASVWLTHRDLPRPVLRALIVRLKADLRAGA